MKLVWYHEGIFYLTTCFIEGTFDFPRDEAARPRHQPIHGESRLAFEEPRVAALADS